MEMDGVQEAAHLRENLADLRAGALQILAQFVGVIGYVWLLAIMWPHTGANASWADWVGALLLVLGASLSYASRHRQPTPAAVLLVTSTLLALLCAAVSFDLAQIAYLFALPVIFASVLFGETATFLVSGGACVLVVFLGRGHWQYNLFSFEIVLPIVVIGLITVASWLSARNLYIALEWVWTGYESAHRSESMAREGQAELRRTLKALDEATYRLERANYMLAIARDQAEEARRLKQQFAQTISHELRTPLNLIVGFTELMIQTPEYYGASLSPKHARDLGIIHRNALHLRSLVNDVLDLARIETAQLALSPEETDVAMLTTEAVNATRSLIETRGLALHVEIEPNIPSLTIDPGRIRQVLFNLLTNAARFTERGSITIKVLLHEEEVLFSVTDTGMGIAEKDKMRIFEEFQQADGGTRRQHEGAGLGLAISKRFVELHGGRIWVDSEVGRGSTFYFTLPLKTDALTEEHHVHPGVLASAATRHGERPILLAVTQSSAAVTLLNNYLHGYRVSAVPDLAHAEHAAKQLLPQAILIDASIGNGDMTGLSALAQAWGLPRTPFLSAPLPASEVSQQQLAADGYLAKPVSREGLWDAVRQFGPGIDKILVVDDDRDFVRLMARLLDSPVRRYQVISAYSGIEGLELTRRHQPDLILLDAVLPDISGAQVLAKLRSDQNHQRLPVVFVSAQDEIDAQQALAGALVATRATGIMPREIVDWLQHWLSATTSSGLAPQALAEEPAR